MNLSKQQVSALVDEYSYRKEIERQNEAQRLKLMKDPANIKLAKNYADHFKVIPANIRSEMFGSYRGEGSKEKFLKAIVGFKHKPKSRINLCKIERIIIIESIEAKNLEDLKKRIQTKIGALVKKK